MSKLDINGRIIATDSDAHTVTTAHSERLTSSEEATLEQLEQKIGHALLSFVDIGKTLAMIRDDRLYRQHHATFEVYCRDRWGFSRQRAHQYIKAAFLADCLSTKVDISRINETQVRPLIGLSDGDVIKAWELAEQISGSEVITGRLVAQAVKTICGDAGAVADNDDDSTTDVEQGPAVGEPAKAKISMVPADEKSVPNKAVDAPVIETQEAVGENFQTANAKCRGEGTKKYVEAELIDRLTEECFVLADGNQSLAVSFPENGAVIAAGAVRGKLQQMAENNAKAKDVHRKAVGIIAGQQALLLILAAALNQAVSRPSINCDGGQIYRAVDELYHLVAHLRPVTTPLK